PRVAERCECGESEHREICERSKHGHRNSAQLGVRTAQYSKAIRRTSATEGLASERLHGQVSCIGQTGHCNNGHCRVKNGAKPRYGHSCGFPANTALIAARTPSGLLSFGSRGWPL